MPKRRDRRPSAIIRSEISQNSALHLDPAAERNTKISIHQQKHAPQERGNNIGCGSYARLMACLLAAVGWCGTPKRYESGRTKRTSRLASTAVGVVACGPQDDGASAVGRQDCCDGPEPAGGRRSRLDRFLGDFNGPIGDEPR